MEYQVIKTFAHKKMVFKAGVTYDFSSPERSVNSELAQLVRDMLQKGYIAKPIQADLKEIKKK